MWKWLAAAALIYGLMAGWAIISPRSMLAVGALDLAALSKAWQASGSAPQLHNFEQQAPPPFVLPESPATVVESEAGNHILSWQPPAEAGLSFLGLPVTAGEPLPHALTVRLRAEGIELLVVGVREEDGSIYTTVLPVMPAWQHYIRPLERLVLAEKSVDENNVLDVEQISAVFIAVKQFAPQRQRRNQRLLDEGIPPPPLVELDDFGFAPPRPDGMGRPFDDQQQPGLGPPDGRPQRRRHPEDQPPARRREDPPPSG